MSVIQKIQEKGAWIIFILIALSMIAFIMMDSSFSRGNLFSNTNMVGKINGTPIDRTEFENRLDMVSKMQGQQAPPREQLVGQLWDYTVQSTTLQQQYEKLGISFTANELEAALFGPHPPQFMVQQFSDDKGNYNVDAARQAFAQIKKQTNNPQVEQFYNAYIQPLIEQSKAQKYQSLFTGAAYEPKWLVEKETADNNAIASFDYVQVPYTSIPDNQVKVSDDEINAYVKKHTKRFESKIESRNVAYVTFNAAASPADSAQLKAGLEKLKPEFGATSDIANFLATNSDGSSNFYDGFVGKKSIQDANKDAILANPVGTVYGPIVSGNNMVLARIVAEAPVADTVTVRHILVATSQQDPQSGQLAQVRDDSAASKRLDSAIAAIKGGASFDSICAVYSDDPGSKTQGGKIENVTAGKMVPEFNNFIFTGHAGETKVVKTQYGYHFIEILSQKGADQGYKLAYLTKAIEPSTNTVSDASTKAQQFAAMSTNLASFQSNAAKVKLAVNAVPNIGENDYAFGQLGENRSFIRWIYDNKVGSVSSPNKVGNDFVVAVVTGIHKPGLPDAASARATVEPIVRNEKKAIQIINTKFKGTTIQAYAQSAGAQVLHLDSVAFASPFIPGIGSEPKVVGAAFNKSMLNKTTTPLAGNAGVFAVLPKSVSAHASAGSPEQIRQYLRQQLKQQSGNSVFQGLINAADVKDYRSKFY